MGRGVSVFLVYIYVFFQFNTYIYLFFITKCIWFKYDTLLY